MAKQFSPDNITKPGVHSAGERNLYLSISPGGNNAKSWQFRYTTNSRTKVIGLGPLHTISFAQAVRAAHQMRGWLLAGLDPKAELAKQHEPLTAVPTFDEVVAAFLAAKESAWSNAKHRAQWRSTLATYASPTIGTLPVDTVATEHILRILTPIWTTKNETAGRVRQRIESVLSYAIAKGQRTDANPARWDDHLEHMLAKPRAVKRVRNHPSLPYQRLPAFMKALRTHTGQAPKMLELLILTATRSGEVRGAAWSEFDLDAGVWVIPAERMKAGVEHEIPLAPVAVELVRSLPRHAGTDLVFPTRNKTPLSDMALNALTRGMNEGVSGPQWTDAKGVPIVPHGFRSTFRVWAGECSNTPRDVAEHALAHQLPDAVERAYQRGTLFPKRVRLMNEWATWVTSDPAVVVPFRAIA